MDRRSFVKAVCAIPALPMLSASPFKGATTVTHPVIAEAAVQFQSRAVAELFPSAGPGNA